MPVYLSETKEVRFISDTQSVPLHLQQSHEWSRYDGFIRLFKLHGTGEVIVYLNEIDWKVCQEVNQAKFGKQIPLQNVYSFVHIYGGMDKEFLSNERPTNPDYWFAHYYIIETSTKALRVFTDWVPDDYWVRTGTMIWDQTDKIFYFTDDPSMIQVKNRSEEGLPAGFIEIEPLNLNFDQIAGRYIIPQSRSTIEAINVKHRLPKWFRVAFTFCYKWYRRMIR